MDKLPICSEMEELLRTIGFLHRIEEDDVVMLEYITNLRPGYSITAIVSYDGYITFREEEWKNDEVVDYSFIIRSIRIDSVDELKFLIRRSICLEKYVIRV